MVDLNTSELKSITTINPDPESQEVTQTKKIRVIRKKKAVEA